MARKYTSGTPSPVFQWVAAQQGQTNYSILMSYTADTVTNTQAPISNLVGQVVGLNVGQVAAPVVSSLAVYQIPAINSAGVSVTLKGTVTGASNCKLIDNSANAYTPTSWSSVNSAYNTASISCPVITEGQAGFTIGNWTSYWGVGQKTLMIWAQSVNEFNAYAAANIGP
jgi:hypothetical protein